LHGSRSAAPQNLKRSPEHREGHRSAEWALLDFGGFVVHVFSEQARRYYDLERLWRHAPKFDIPDQPDGPSSDRNMPESHFGHEHFSGEAASGGPQSGRFAAMTEERLPWITADPASLRLFELAEKVAIAPATLLITGESGCGKDHLARLVHELGPRRDAPFLKIDCASLPPQLVESELFGHERGAFTGAVERKLGRFELGGNGSIVLDEVAGAFDWSTGQIAAYFAGAHV